MSGISAVVIVDPGSPAFAEVLKLADAILQQRRHIVSVVETASRDCVLGAFDGSRCIGFLRFFVQVVGAEEGRPPVFVDGSPLTEGYVEALGVAADARRLGVGSALQERAVQICRGLGCHQMRSRSPVSSSANFAMKLASGDYVLQPSHENDSYYFLRKL